MSQKGEKKRLNEILGSHLCTIHDTLQVWLLQISLTLFNSTLSEVILGVELCVIIIQVLDQTAASSLEKVNWEEIIKMGDHISKQATIGNNNKKDWIFLPFYVLGIFFGCNFILGMMKVSFFFFFFSFVVTLFCAYIDVFLPFLSFFNRFSA